MLFEGCDGAGKGGAIKALTERVSPRVFRGIAEIEPGMLQSGVSLVKDWLEISQEEQERRLQA
ncbi:polyphosphate kinase 2 family protein [Rhodovastum atsumiense]|uniref:hypothetical protein n=1 Tax=Rhodovastum atsumiense TaxID=504468 RepID=UPI0038D0AAFC